MFWSTQRVATFPGRLPTARSFGPCPSKRARPSHQRYPQSERPDQPDAGKRDQSFQCPADGDSRRKHGGHSQANYRRPGFGRSRYGSQTWSRLQRYREESRARNVRAIPRFCTGRRLLRYKESCHRAQNIGEELEVIPAHRLVHRPSTFPCIQVPARNFRSILSQFSVFHASPVAGCFLRCSDFDEQCSPRAKK
jgi:hypothetical protein